MSTNKTETETQLTLSTEFQNGADDDNATSSLSQREKKKSDDAKEQTKSNLCSCLRQYRADDDDPYFIVFNYCGDSLNIPKEKPNKQQLKSIYETIVGLRNQEKKYQDKIAKKQNLKALKDDDDDSKLKRTETYLFTPKGQREFADISPAAAAKKYLTNLGKALKEQQDVLATEPWCFVKGDQVENLKNYIQKNGISELIKDGAVGETFIHDAILYGANKCVTYLIREKKNDRRIHNLCLKVYRHEEYYGESILHMIIATNNEELFDLLLPPQSEYITPEQKMGNKIKAILSKFEFDDKKNKIKKKLNIIKMMLEDDDDGDMADNGDNETDNVAEAGAGAVDSVSNKESDYVSVQQNENKEEEEEEEEETGSNENEKYAEQQKEQKDDEMEENKQEKEEEEAGAGAGDVVSNKQKQSSRDDIYDINKNKQLLFTRDELEHLMNDKRAVGRFFDANCGTVDYGQHAVTFAVVLGRKKMIKRLYEYGAEFDVKDSNDGDTIFHYIAKKNQVDMFEYLFNSGDVFTEKNEKEWITYVQWLNERNAERYTPLQYAVHHKNIEIYKAMLEFKKQKVWGFGDVEFVGYPLNEIDTHGDNPRSVLETILAENAVDFINEPVIKAVLQDKWDKFVQKYFILWCGLHLLYVFVLLALFAFFIEYYNKKSTSIVLKILIFIITMAKVGFTEWQRISEVYILADEHGWKNASQIFFQWHLDGVSVTLFFNAVLLFSNVMLVGLWITLFADIGPNNENEKYVIIFMTLSFLGEALYILWFAQVFPLMGRLVITTVTIITGDIIRFFVLFIVILIAFAGAIQIAYGQSIGLGRTCIQLFYISIGEGDPWVDEESEDYANYQDWQIAFNEVIYFLFLVVSAVLLFNLLIAVFSETIDELGERKEDLFAFQRASIILSIERKVDEGVFAKVFKYDRTGDNYKDYGFNAKVLETEKKKEKKSDQYVE